MSSGGWTLGQSERNSSTVMQPHSTSGESNTKECIRTQTKTTRKSEKSEETTRKSEKSEVVLVLSRALEAKALLLSGCPKPVSELYLQIISTPAGEIFFLKF
jgi:hypothetical protein